MKQVRVTAKGEAIRVWIDGVRIRLSNHEGSRPVPAGEHVLSWIVRGSPGSTYRVEITAPPEARMKREGTLDQSLIDAGMDWFRINANE